jgi:hypothetical protein
MIKEKPMNQNKHTVCNQAGAVLIIVAVSLIVMLGFAALSIDFGRRMVFENKVQNAVDAGALAGGRALYFDNGNGLNITGAAGADAMAKATTLANSPSAGSFPPPTVEIGNWTFATRTFTEIQNPTEINITGWSTERADLDTTWVNAVRVEASTTGVTNFLAGLFNYEDFAVTKDAVAYRGFPGGMGSREADQPIVVCWDSISDGEDGFLCNVGRFTNSSDKDTSSDTVRWSTLAEQGQGCGGNSPAGELRKLVNCNGSVNHADIPAGTGLPTNNGELESVMSVLRDCFFKEDPPRAMNVTLPVINCNEGPTCGTIITAVNMDIVWITESGTDSQFKDAPESLADENGVVIWPETPFPVGTTGQDRWKDFVDHFELEDVNGAPDTEEEKLDFYNNMTIYFKTTCNEEDPPPAGDCCGPPTNIRAKYPKLVE